jgi:peptidoglycan L-alanyl-D-glutamate endopeptidase CwlK
MAAFGKTSLNNLHGVNELLVQLMEEAIKDTPIDFTIVEGLRTIERQKQLLLEKKTKTIKSKHLTGNAVDICPYVNGKLDWNNKEAFKKVTDHIKETAKRLGINIVCGIDWTNSWDSPHVELKIS